MSQPDSRPRVALLVTDLDNTLYDWFAMWYPAFNAMLEAVCSKSGVPRDVLLAEIPRFTSSVALLSIPIYLTSCPL